MFRPSSGGRISTSGALALVVLGFAVATILQQSRNSSQPTASVTTSSAMPNLDASGLLMAVPPGWHAQNPAIFPEWIEVKYAEPHSKRRDSQLAQSRYPERAPKRIRILTSADGAQWELRSVIEDACVGARDDWHTFGLDREIVTTHVRLEILSNCGDPHLVTMRGLALR